MIEIISGNITSRSILPNGTAFRSSRPALSRGNSFQPDTLRQFRQKALLNTEYRLMPGAHCSPRHQPVVGKG